MKPHTEIMLRTAASNAERLCTSLSMILENEKPLDLPRDLAPLCDQIGAATAGLVLLARRVGYIGDMDPLSAAMQDPEGIRSTLGLDSDIETGSEFDGRLPL